MKREITCTRCWLGREMSWPGHDEQIKYAFGLARSDAQGPVIRCDTCNAPLPRGTLAVAVSIWTNSLLDAYHPWESKYLKVITNAEADAIMRLGGGD